MAQVSGELADIVLASDRGRIRRSLGRAFDYLVELRDMVRSDNHPAHIEKVEARAEAYHEAAANRATEGEVTYH